MQAKNELMTQVEVSDISSGASPLYLITEMYSFSRVKGANFFLLDLDIIRFKRKNETSFFLLTW